MKRFWCMAFAVLLTIALQAQQQHGDGIDDVLQHTPMASVLLLKACGVDNQHSWTETLGTTVVSYVIAAGVTYSLKHTIKEWRPDHSDQRSFPSGHATFAFAGASALRHEFGSTSPWITAGGYAVATLTAVDRVVKDRHHWYDVCGGAAIGTLATELTYYIKGKVIKNDHAEVALAPNGLYLSLRW